MSETQQQRSHAREQLDQPRCDAELHVRLCARRLSTGHLQFRWRIEHVDNIGEEADSLDGTFSPFILPHEAGQEVAAAVRSWWKTAHTIAARAVSEEPSEVYGEQLTLRDFLTD